MSATSDPPSTRAAEPGLPSGGRLGTYATVIWTDIRRHWGDFAVAMLATFASAGVALLLPGRARALIEDAFPSRDVSRIASLLVVLLAIVSISIGFSTVRRFFMERLCLRLINDWQRRLFAHVLSMSPARLQSLEGGQVMSGFTNDLQVLHAALRTLLAVIVPSIVFTLIYVGAMVWFSWLLSIFLSLLVVPLVLATNFFGRRIHHAAHVAQRRLGALLADLTETLGGSREIKLFGMEARVLERFRALTAASLEAQVTREGLSALHPLIVSLSVAVGIAGIILFSMVLLNAGWIGLAELTGFVVSLALAYPPIQEISHATGQVFQLFTALDRVMVLMDMPGERDVTAGFGMQPRDAGISFESVGFDYGDEDFALREISFSLAPGERLAIVGASGAGKSTLLELLPRFREPKRGRILIGGVDTAMLPLALLRRRIGLVLQVPFLFRATLLENLMAGAPEATRAQVLDVAGKARVDEFAQRLPQGYDTMIEPGGTNLSVGQRQRIAIARVLLKDPPILLLDEPTSALDATSERLVGDAIRQVARNRTTIIVAHRMSTVRDVDRVIVMEGGRIVEQGSPEALLALDGIYARLCRQSAMIEAQ